MINNITYYVRNVITYMTICVVHIYANILVPTTYNKIESIYTSTYIQNIIMRL